MSLNILWCVGHPTARNCGAQNVSCAQAENHGHQAKAKIPFGLAHVLVSYLLFRMSSSDSLFCILHTLTEERACLVLAWTLYQNTINLVDYSQQKFISYNSGGWYFQGQAASQFGVLTRSLLLGEDGCHPTESSLGGSSELAPWPLLQKRALIPFMRAPTSWPSYLPKAPPPHAITLGISTYELWGTKHSVHNRSVIIDDWWLISSSLR